MATRLLRGFPVTETAYGGTLETCLFHFGDRVVADIRSVPSLGTDFFISQNIIFHGIKNLQGGHMAERNFLAEAACCRRRSLQMSFFPLKKRRIRV